MQKSLLTVINTIIMKFVMTAIRFECNLLKIGNFDLLNIYYGSKAQNFAIARVDKGTG